MAKGIEKRKGEKHLKIIFMRVEERRPVRPPL
jgi:hypothetical protein